MRVIQKGALKVPWPKMSIPNVPQSNFSANAVSDPSSYTITIWTVNI